MSLNPKEQQQPTAAITRTTSAARTFCTERRLCLAGLLMYVCKCCCWHVQWSAPACALVHVPRAADSVHGCQEGKQGEVAFEPSQKCGDLRAALGSFWLGEPVGGGLDAVGNEG